MPSNFKSIAKMIDHSLLHPTLTDLKLVTECQLTFRCHLIGLRKILNYNLAMFFSCEAIKRQYFILGG